MNVGDNIKSLRIKTGLTQKELSDKLNVSFQTISKWENGTNEPDLSSMKKMCSIFNCSMDNLTCFDNEASASAAKETTIQIGVCADCNKTLFSDDHVHHLERKSSDGVIKTVNVCDSCFTRHEELNKQKDALLKPVKPTKDSKFKFLDKITDRNDSKVLIWSLAVGGVLLLISLIICLCNYNSVGLGKTIGLPLFLGYLLCADIYCIFSASWIGELFADVATWSVKFPGIIFSFDLDGI